jgi:hypothetical protein
MITITLNIAIRPIYSMSIAPSPNLAGEWWMWDYICKSIELDDNTLICKFMWLRDEIDSARLECITNPLEQYRNGKARYHRE